ncbi:peroxide stress protein YaaA [Flavobacteriales bacterium]|nr:peroxide stress protein YaaA [Flavobacteriales bacterium]
MKIIISPAKKLITEKISVDKSSLIQFSYEARYLIDQLRGYNVNEIKQLMSLSNNLAKLNHDRYQQFDLKSEKSNPAIYMFQGDVYKGLKADKLSDEDLAFAQDHLRIISGLYGLLKPLDLIFPYRLEMGTKLKTDKGESLYDFWGHKLNKVLRSEMEEKEVLVNLASNEYSKALKLESFNQPIITPVFKDYKNGKLKVISFFAKKARGEMVSFIVKNKIKDPVELKLFSNDGYIFSEENNGEVLFVR